MRNNLTKMIWGEERRPFRFTADGNLPLRSKKKARTEAAKRGARTRARQKRLREMELIRREMENLP